MTKNNNLIPVNKAPIETVYKLKDYEIKKTPLSPSARGKVINRNGSSYLSKKMGEINPSYGPMWNTVIIGCYPTKAEYDVYISLTEGYSFKQSGVSFTSCKISGEVENLYNIRGWLKKLEDGEITIVKGSDRNSQCVEYEDYFKTNLRHQISEIEKMDHYGVSRVVQLSRP